MKNLIKNLFLAISSIVFVLFLAEFTLYLSGRIYYSYRVKNKIPKAKEKNLVRILCLGDSFTFGMGAERGYSYPEQLEKLLRERVFAREYVLYNRGVPGNTSSKIVKNLVKDFEDINPAILLVLIGMNDKIVLEETNFAPLWGKWITNADTRLEQLRIYKLLKYGYKNFELYLWKKKIKNRFSIRLRNTKRCMDNSKNTRIQDTEKSTEYEKHIVLGNRYFTEYYSDVQLAVCEFKKAIEVCSDKEEAYLGLADIFVRLGQIESAIDCYKKAKKNNPQNPGTYRMLSELYYRIGDPDSARNELEEYLSLVPEDIQKYISILKWGMPSTRTEQTHTRLNTLLVYNLNKIMELSKNRGIELIVQNYPVEWDSGNNEVIRSFAFKNNVPLVDNSKIFMRIALTQDYRYADFFAEDNHCNNEGYFVMAENVYNTIKNGNLLDMR